MTKRVLLMILDGWGIAKDPKVSAVDLAHTPFMDSLPKQFPHATLEASGSAVGLPDDQMGNSEVGHMNLGAGRIVYQDLARINLAITSRSIFDNPTLLDAFALAKAGNKKLHFMGLVSDGGVHAHINHLKGLLTMAYENGIQNCFVHAFTDGRDCDPQSGKGFLNELESHMAATTGKLATVVGRYFAMDRDKRWERVKKAYDVLVSGKGSEASAIADALQASYDAGVTDEFIEPICLDANGCIQSGDVVINFNFRTDRGREITQVLTQEAFPDYGMAPLDLHYVTLTRYDDTFKNISVVFEKPNLDKTLGEVLAAAGKTQVRIAETEKYPHVTFFFNGGREVPFDGEERILCPSPKVATYDLQPEMSAFAIRDAILPVLTKQSADFICLNFANPDMVGHTGVMEAAIKACEVVDSCTATVVSAALSHDYDVIVIADHGNADCMKNSDGSPNTAHTTQPVPFILATTRQGVTLKQGVLGDVAPTVLHLMGIKQPEEMTGTSLVSF
ncbi:MAG: 2,3-bisphosphoglycerate-independent phosphoglycerate mutase [Schleiferiaceae bacterium]|nr:2,3-bisphosphoglycerate-independent phosphoglycerate mutase [Schleiferiaceae bacterium]